MTTLRLARHQLRYELRGFRRNPAGVFFTLGLPVLMLVIFTTLNRDEHVRAADNRTFASYFVPGMLAFGVMSATYGNLAARFVFRREAGLLKRARSTPMPPTALLGGIIGNAIVVSGCITVVVLAVGRLAYDVPLPHRWLLLAAVLAVGTASFCALGLALATFIPNVDAADPMAFGTLLPLLFISGVFQPVPADSILHRIAVVFPVSHLFDAALSTTGPPPGAAVMGHLAVVAAWGVVGALVAVRRFRWEPGRP